jgi:dihydroorotase/N-acyl-D-amino-acid deacylase
MLCTTMDEEGVRLKLQQPWIFFGTDAGERTPGPQQGNSHPRALGAYPRVLGRYVRELRVLSLEKAVQRMSAAVAEKLSIRDRGVLAVGMRADVVLFNPDTIMDHATEEQPFLPSTGMLHVLVNGVLVLDNGVYTGARPGMAVRGPGWKVQATAPSRAGQMQ